MTETVLILGANGRMGRNAAAAFTRAGWQVRRFDRANGALTSAAQGVDVIFNGWNPPYSRWQEQLPGLTDQVIAAARSSGATVLLPGNVYVFGAEMPPLIGPGVPHRAANPLGRLRVGMEDSYRRSGVRTILLRAGDFIDTAASGNWFDMIIAKKAAKGRLSYPGPLDQPHAWAYLPDLADTFVQLAAIRDRLEPFTDLAFPGYTLTGADLAAACGKALRRDVRAKRMGWLPVHLARPFWAEAKHLLEMRFLWTTAHELDGRLLESLLPGRVETPVVDALVRALDHQIHPDKPVARGEVAV